jgi:sugar O-acyltransferase (sialic acid O-acetyltransferase NeuD family)
VSKDLYVWGTGGHAKSLAEIAMASGFQIRAFISPNSDFRTFLGFNAYPDLPEGLAPTNAVIAIGIGDNFTRQKVWVELNKTYPISMFPPLIHPTASIAKDSEIGQGSTVHQNSVVGTSSQVGIFCTLNTSSSIEHDCTVGDFASLGPGTRTGGNVTIGERAVLAIGSTARHGVRIGDDSVLGAASYAHESIPPLTVAVGAPASFLKSRKAHDRYL